MTFFKTKMLSTRQFFFTRVATGDKIKVTWNIFADLKYFNDKSLKKLKQMNLCLTNEKIYS